MATRRSRGVLSAGTQKPFVVLNPGAGGGRAGRTFAEVKAVLERRIGVVDMVATAHGGHAIELSRDAVRAGRSLVIAAGGDGTLHEVVNGVLAAGGETAVGYLGLGTGGDFRRTLGIEHRLETYVDVIARAELRALDVGRVRYRAPDGAVATRWFVNILSAGMGGLVDRHVAATPKILGGKAAYLFASARALVDSQRGRLRCVTTLGGTEETRVVDAYMIAICNGRYFGGGMHVAPMAEPDDGRFEVISMDAPNKIAFAMFSRRIYGGAHLRDSGVSHFPCDRIAIDLENEAARPMFLIDVDGEALGGLPIEIELVRRAIRVCT